MPRKAPATPLPFVATKGKGTLKLHALTAKDCAAWLKKAPAATRQRAEQANFTARPGQVLALYDDKGHLISVLAGVNSPLQLFDLAAASEALARSLSEKTLKGAVFEIDGVKAAELEKACIGWGLAAYRFDSYKGGKKNSAFPKLLWPAGVKKNAVEAHIESASLIRTLINIPANDMGPDELEDAAKTLAGAEGLTIRVIRDKDLLKHNFPMIHAVGKGSTRRPRLIDMHWGNTRHPKITLVGKGVCFDTGGLDIKPPAAMYTMKKDMGGAAHVLGLALLIIRYKLPVRLRVLIPAVENSISGDSYRPSDVLDSRKGLTVEVGDTDAEGRLILADALALACEEKPALLVNFATLTGAARVALGVEIPVIFSNNEKLAFTLKDIGMANDDPLWPLPLWQPYRKEMASDIADLSSTGVGKAGAITAALFLESFVDPKVDWVHIDLYAWDHGGKPGRTKGGTEMASRALFAYLQNRFGKK
ncbi:MAG: leucyl aminopeptidase family protein [Micavibrio aeruginosavorus]|nr:leucyl aminopeptidase family protein [Micavibrio aeruginosavorus]